MGPSTAGMESNSSVMTVLHPREDLRAPPTQFSGERTSEGLNAETFPQFCSTSFIKAAKQVTKWLYPDVFYESFIWVSIVFFSLPLFFFIFIKEKFLVLLLLGQNKHIFKVFEVCFKSGPRIFSQIRVSKGNENVVFLKLRQNLLLQ